MPAAAAILRTIQFRIGAANAQRLQRLARTVRLLVRSWFHCGGAATLGAALHAAQAARPVEIGAHLACPFLAVSYVAVSRQLLLLEMGLLLGLLLSLSLGLARKACGCGLDGQTSCRLLRAVIVVYCLRWTETVKRYQIVTNQLAQMLNVKCLPKDILVKQRLGCLAHCAF